VIKIMELSVLQKVMFGVGVMYLFSLICVLVMLYFAKEDKSDNFYEYPGGHQEITKGVK